MLKRHLSEKQHSLLMGLVQDHVLMDVFEGVPRGRQLIQHTAGALEGDPGRQGGFRRDVGMNWEDERCLRLFFAWGKRWH